MVKNIDRKKGKEMVEVLVVNTRIMSNNGRWSIQKYNNLLVCENLTKKEKSSNCSPFLDKWSNEFPSQDNRCINEKDCCHNNKFNGKINPHLCFCRIYIKNIIVDLFYQY